MRNILLSTIAVAAFLAPLAASAAGSCSFQSGPIKRLVVVEFDNVHLARTNPNVPSDLEQMPALLNYLKANGLVDGNNHPPLISHTANDIITSQTGTYPDRTGTAISNSFFYYGTGTPSYASDFVYWTDQLANSAADTTRVIIDQTGRNAPAPWVSFTRAGCDTGYVALGDTTLENTGSDIITVFGANSPEAREAARNSNKAYADFLGIGVHCAQGSARCAAGQAEPDRLPDEPHGYRGYQALFGHKYTIGALTGSKSIQSLSGTTISGFPGYGSMTPDVSMAYVATMLEHNVPVVYAYVTNAHNGPKNAYGPGQPGYEQTLAAFNTGFDAFFQRMAKDGFTAANTLFVFSSDEGDHFVGGPPHPAGCDGVTTPCQYKQLGEVDDDISSLLFTIYGESTPFTIHNDMAPAFYLNNNPGQTDANVRRIEQELGRLRITDPVEHKPVGFTTALADRAEMAVLHMVTADPLRTPTFVDFNYPDFYTMASSPPKLCKPLSACITENRSFAWNHGGINPDVAEDWVAFAGPNVQVADVQTWTDQPDVRPTYLAALGLKDDYVHDGRVVAEFLSGAALPPSVAQNLAAYTALTDAYKQLDAPFGTASMATLSYATKNIETKNSKAYAAYVSKIGAYTQDRDGLTVRIKALLDDVFFGGQVFSASRAQTLTTEANALIARAKSLDN